MLVDVIIINGRGRARSLVSCDVSTRENNKTKDQRQQIWVRDELNKKINGRIVRVHIRTDADVLGLTEDILGLEMSLNS